MNISKIAHTRYTTKKYDPSKNIPQELMNQLIDLLHFCPSSINSQPFHFIVVTSEEGKKRVGASMDEDVFIYNKSKILDASATVVICSKTEMTEEHIRKVLDQEEKDGRIIGAEKKQKTLDLYMGYVNAHLHDTKDINCWMEKQCYIALGALLLGAASLHIDATPIEGFNRKILDRDLELREQGYTSLLLVPLGYHANDDYNFTLPKSRLPKDQIFKFL